MQEKFLEPITMIRDKITVIKDRIATIEYSQNFDKELVRLGIKKLKKLPRDNLHPNPFAG